MSRDNQKARTRAALLDAASVLLREGRPPSIPDAAARALVSVPTAYRYFPSADELWFEAAQMAISFAPALAETEDRIEAAGGDPIDRLEALVRTLNFTILEDQAPFRRLARAALDVWFEQAGSKATERFPVREGRRNRYVALAIEPLRGAVDDADVDRIARALAIVIGTDAMLAVTDAAGLEGDDARQAMLDAARWMLRGALTEMGAPPTGFEPVPPP